MHQICIFQVRPRRFFWFFLGEGVQILLFFMWKFKFSRDHSQTKPTPVGGTLQPK